MESAVPDQPQSKISQFVRSLGPGILMASAAVGGSHLVASTKRWCHLWLATRRAYPASKPF